MNDITDGIGAAIEGGLAGRAVEPSHGEAGDADGDQSAFECLNCGTTFSSAFCPACGQKREVHRSLAAIGHDIMHGVLHLDGKLWRTLPLLLLKPGELTRRYIDGERAKFVSPMAFFLFSVFAMFAVFQMVGLSAPTDLSGEMDRMQAESELAKVEEQLAEPDLPPLERIDLEAKQSQLTAELGVLQQRGEGLDVLLATEGSEVVETLKSSAEAQVEDARQRLETLPEGSPERAELAEEIALAERGLAEFNGAEEEVVQQIPLDDDGNSKLTIEKSGIPILDSALDKWRQNPSLMLYKMQANGYKFSWLLIPLSIPFVWLTFAWRRRFKAYDHAVFVTYSLGFMSMLFITMSLIGSGEAFILFALVAPLHLYKHLKYTYGLSRFSAIWRLVVLSFCILMILVLFLQALLLLGAF